MAEPNKTRMQGSTTRTALIGGALIGLFAVGVFVAERRRPLRAPTQPPVPRKAANAVLGIASMAVMAAVERPVTQRLAKRAEARRSGLVQHLPLPPLARDLLAVILTDYAMYLWHVATHRVPFLWRFHLVHHIDMDLDATTALRFHALDMAISAPVRYAQVALIGASPRALAIWQHWFFASVLFHHSNVRLPERLERVLARALTTPRMHGIHHSAIEGETNSNWSSGLALWDHLHGTFRLDVPQDVITIGVAAYRDPKRLGVQPSLALPFEDQRDAWDVQPGAPPGRLAGTRGKVPPMPELLEPSQLSQELREGEGTELARRRAAIGLSFAGAAIGGVVGAYQTGVISRLPDILPGKVFDAEKVDASDYAYRNLQQPDGPMMLVNYGLTAMALAAGGKDRAAQNPALPVLSAAKAVFDLVLCAALAREEWRENRKLCSWCQVATGISAVTVALTLPEAVKVLRPREASAEA